MLHAGFLNCNAVLKHQIAYSIGGRLIKDKVTTVDALGNDLDGNMPLWIHAAKVE